MTFHAFSTTELAQMNDLTPRRVRQYAEEGLLPAIERGKYDAAFFMYLRVGEQRTRNASKRPDRDTLVALGWLAGVGDNPGNDDVKIFPGLFERNGIERERALIALGRAQGMMRK